MSSVKFAFKEHDEEGFNTLNSIAQTHRFNQWMYQSIRPYLRGEILEIGSGIGNITQYVADDQLSITASDIRETYCQVLRNRFAANDYIKAVKNIDIAHPNFDEVYKSLIGTFDCVFALNALEHIEQHVQAVANCSKLLKPKGRLIILVPAFQMLYNGFDRELQHFRRYTKESLQQVLVSVGFSIV
ncbi:MAG: class I SAM-dependent methyltransferase, partial [Chitinophagaceae bacterium]